MGVEIKKRDQVTIASLGAEYQNLDGSALHAVSVELLEAADQADPPWLVIDLSHTTFFASAFIEVLFRVWNRINKRPGSKFGLSGLTPHCRDVIEVAHLDTLWKLYDSEEQAVSAMTT